MSHVRRQDRTIAPLSHSDAQSFIVANHYSRTAANTSVARLGLYDGEQLVGACLWMPPTKAAAVRTMKDLDLDPAAWRGVLALSRLAIAEGEPTNSASMLLGAAMRHLDREVWPVLVTYADTNHGHTGAIYRATNWTEIGPTKAGTCWVGPNGEQRGRKRGPVNLTADEMRELGFVKAPAAPKIKFAHVSKRHRRSLAPIVVAR